MFPLIILILFTYIVADHAVFVTHQAYAPFIFTDPSAAHVVSALRILNGQTPLFYYHPGCAYYTLLSLCLLPLKSYVWHKHIDLFEFVYLHKEFVLLYLQFFTLFLSLSGLYYLNLAAVNMTKQKWSGLLVILLFLASQGEYHARLWAVGADGYLIFISGIVLFLFSRYVSSDGENTSKRKYLYPSFLLAGLGLAGKVSLLPLGIFLFFFLSYEIKKNRIPLSGKLKEFFLCAACIMAGFLSGVMVMGPQILNFFNFVYVSATHQGPYEHGGPGLNIAMTAQNISGIILHNGSFILLLVVLQIHLFYKKAGSKDPLDPVGKYAMIFFLVLASAFIYLGILIVKPLAIRYNIVTAVLISFALSMALDVLAGHKKIAVILILTTALAGACYQRLFAYQRLLLNTEQADQDMENLIKKHHIDIHKDIILFDSGSIKNKNIYFLYGNMFAGDAFKEVLLKYQPNIFILSKHKDTIYGYTGWHPIRKDWQFAIISKHQALKYPYEKRLRARVLDIQGNSYLLTPQ